jgi:hypothetical protein
LEEVRKFLEVLAGEEPFYGLELVQHRRLSFGVALHRRRVRCILDRLPQNGREERLWPVEFAAFEILVPLASNTCQGVALWVRVSIVPDAL